MANQNELQLEIDALRAENERLRQQATGSDQQKPTTTHITTWNGHPVIRFEGQFRPFGLGLRKAAVILERIDDIKFFVENNWHRMGNEPDNDQPKD